MPKTDSSQIVNGEMIPGTRLRRRYYANGRESTEPEYLEDPTGKEPMHCAFEQAEAHGYRRLLIWKTHYEFLAGEWYAIGCTPWEQGGRLPD